MNKKFVLFCLILIIASIYFIMHSHQSTVLGADSRGYVTKEIYSYLGTSDEKIALVTGMHPREKVSKNVVEDIAKTYTFSHKVELINYRVVVTDNPDNYTIGRTNGEGLVADYVYPDILKSDYDLVIICHDHMPGYGEGFYIATPKMDQKSVTLAESVNASIAELEYYKSPKNIRAQSTSAALISRPLALAGYPTLVYEMPYTNYQYAYEITNKLIETSFNFLI
jgi:hypothetical protein